MKKTIQNDEPAIFISVDGRPKKRVSRADYVRAKTRQLREFGYSNLTEDEVNTQITAILDGKLLDVIGMFMKDEVSAA